jgi:uncharacterized membrane protein
MQRQLKRYVWAICLVVALPLVALAVQYIRYDYPNPSESVSGRPKATITEAFGIDNNGRIAGSYCVDDDSAGVGACSAPGNAPSHGYVKDGKFFTEINFPHAFETEATGINDEGLVVGLFDPKLNPGRDTGHGYWCQYPCPPDSFHQLDYPFGGAVSTDIQAVNEYDEMVGVWSADATPPIRDHGWLLDDEGKFCSIDVPGAGAADTNALGINDHSDVVGSYSFDDPAHPDVSLVKAFILEGAYTNGQEGTPCAGAYRTFVYPNHTTPPVLTVSQTEAAGINEEINGDRWIVGNYLDQNQQSHAFKVLFKNNKFVNFQTIDVPGQTGSPDNAATSLNNAGDIVGNFEDTSLAKKERAFLRKK